MTMTESEAYEAMLRHHRVLTEQLAGRADAVAGAVAAGQPHAAAVAGLLDYLKGEVLPHAAAEEKTLYAAAVAHAGLGDMIGEMVAEHATLSVAGSRLASLPDGGATAREAQRIASLFTAHASRENEMLLPALLACASVDLAGLLEQMHRDGAHDHPAHQGQGEDLPAALLSLLLQGTAALARAGDADRASRLAASAWAALQGSRPDLAGKVTAALHGLTRNADGAPGGGEPSDGGGPVLVELTTAPGPDLDVRDLAPAQRHTVIFDACRALPTGADFVLVNDHDPKPLRYQLEAEHGGEFSWEYLEEGPQAWRVRIGRQHAAPGPGARDGVREPELDVRRVTHRERHGLIFATYQALRPGTGFVLVNDHDPKPLRYQFEAQYKGEYTWEYLEAGPGTWRVRISRAGA